MIPGWCSGSRAGRGQKPRPVRFPGCERPLVYQRGCRFFTPEEGVRLPHGRLIQGPMSMGDGRSLKPEMRVQLPRALLNSRGVV